MYCIVICLPNENKVLGVKLCQPDKHFATPSGIL